MYIQKQIKRIKGFKTLITAAFASHPTAKDMFYLEKSFTECDLAVIMLESYHDINSFNYLSKASIKDCKNILYKPLRTVAKGICTDKFINHSGVEKDMGAREIYETIKKGWNTVAAGVHTVDHMEDLAKIVFYHSTAQQAKDVYHDTKTYEFLREECITTFNTINDKIVKDKLTKLVDKEFLKYSPDAPKR